MGRSATPGRLLEQDPVQSVVSAVVAVVDVSTRPRHVTRGRLLVRNTSSRLVAMKSQTVVQFQM